MIVSFKKKQQLKMRLTIIRKSACVPVNTGISMGTLTVYGLFNRTPKFLSPLRSSSMNTPICIKPTRAENKNNLN